MATPIYFKASNIVIWGGDVGGSGSNQAEWNAGDASREVTPGASAVSAIHPNAFDTTIGTGTGGAQQVFTVTGPTAGVHFIGGVNPLGFVTDPIAADVTINNANNVTFNCCGKESSMNANATFRMAVYRLDNLGALTLIVNSALGTELGTALARSTWTAAPTTTNLKKGDRLVVLPMIDDATATTMASGFTVDLQVGGSNANLADSNITFVETITFITSDPSGSVYYLLDSASDISGSKALSTTQGSGTATATHTTVAGALTFPGDPWTVSAGGADLKHLSPAFNAFTLGGLLTLELGYSTALDREGIGAGAPNDRLFPAIVVRDNDGSNPVVWAYGYAGAITATDAPNIKKWYFSGPDTAVGQGKRVGVELFQDDYRPQNASAGTDRTIRYDGTSTYASKLTFTQTITEASFTPTFAFPFPRRDRAIIPLI